MQQLDRKQIHFEKLNSSEKFIVFLLSWFVLIKNSFFVCFYHFNITSLQVFYNKLYLKSYFRVTSFCLSIFLHLLINYLYYYSVISTQRHQYGVGVGVSHTGFLQGGFWRKRGVKICVE